jgi:hypothetical protein
VVTSVKRLASAAAAVGTAVEVWKALQTGAGLELRRGRYPGRDAEMEAAIVKVLRDRFPDLPAAPFDTLHSLLKSDRRSSLPYITTESLVSAVFDTQRGFAAMMRAILEVLADAQATNSAQSLSIRLGFGDGSESLQLLLDEFRQQVMKLERVLESRFELGSTGLLRDVRGAAQNAVKTLPIEEALLPEIESKPGVGFGAPPAPPPTGNVVLDGTLAVMTRYVEDLRLWMAQVFGPRDRYFWDKAQQMAKLGEISKDDLDRVVCISNYFDCDIVDGVHGIADAAVRLPVSIPDLIARLSNIVGVIPRRQVWVDKAVSELSELLQMPVWKYRYELYSRWVGTILLRTTRHRADNFRFLPNKGVLSFAFGGSRLATFTYNGKDYEIAAEMRTKLRGAPSKLRKQNIQPDFRVCSLPESADRNVDTCLVVECKHYLRVKVENFTAAANDYARSCEMANVIVVNHGEGENGRLVSGIETGHAARVSFINRASIDSDGGAELVRAIENALFPAAARPVQEGATEEVFYRQLPANLVASIRVHWDASLHDVDLSLRFGAHEVKYSSRGALDQEPYAQLSRDVQTGPGQEVVEASRFAAVSYEVRVTNFSKRGLLGKGNVYCDVMLRETVYRLRPSVPQADCWVVGRIATDQPTAMFVPSNESIVISTTSGAA